MNPIEAALSEEKKARARFLWRSRAGKLDAVEELYRSHSGPVYALARRLCRTPEEAEEVLQETFIEVARSLVGFRGEGSLAGWIKRIAANKALMRLRYEKLRRHEPLDRALEDLQTGYSPPRVTDRLDLEAALDRLPQVSRAVVWLHDVEGYTHREIGEITGRTASFSKSQLARSHKRLRELLSHDGNGQPTVRDEGSER